MADPLAEIVAARAQARAAQDALADLCMLATCSAEAVPACRTLVLREVGPRGLGLLLSASSPKWADLEQTGQGEVLIHWRSIARQYRARGPLAPLPEELVARYWEQKSHGSRLLDRYYHEVAPQSSPVASREVFLAGVEALRARYPTPADVPRPPELRGVWLVPERIECWHGSPADRLHHRRLFTRQGQGWQEQVLVP